MLSHLSWDFKHESKIDTKYKNRWLLFLCSDFVLRKMRDREKSRKCVNKIRIKSMCNHIFSHFCWIIHPSIGDWIIINSNGFLNSLQNTFEPAFVIHSNLRTLLKQKMVNFMEIKMKRKKKWRIGFLFPHFLYSGSRSIITLIKLC